MLESAGAAQRGIHTFIRRLHLQDLRNTRSLWNTGRVIPWKSQGALSCTQKCNISLSILEASAATLCFNPGLGRLREQPRAHFPWRTVGDFASHNKMFPCHFMFLVKEHTIVSTSSRAWVRLTGLSPTCLTKYLLTVAGVSATRCNKQ